MNHVASVLKPTAKSKNEPFENCSTFMLIVLIGVIPKVVDGHTKFQQLLQSRIQSQKQLVKLRVLTPRNPQNKILRIIFWGLVNLVK